MDYVSNNVTVSVEQRQDKGAALLAYDMAFAAKKNEKRKEKGKNAKYQRISGIYRDEP